MLALQQYLFIMDDDDELQRAIDEEFLHAEQFLGSVSDHRRWHSNAERTPRRTPKKQQHEEQQRQQQHALQSAFSSSSSSWSASQKSHLHVETAGSSAAEKLQRKIDELERKLAEASVELTSAERKAGKRRAGQARQAQRGLRTPGSNPVLSPPFQARSPESRPMVAFSLGAVDVGDLDSSAAGGAEHKPDEGEEVEVVEVETLTAESSRVNGLALVMNNLASPTRGLLGATPERVSSEALPTALQLAGASRRLWHLLAQTTWKREADAAVRLQRVQRGRAARLSARTLAHQRHDLVEQFLDEHGSEWKRTPSQNDLQACVLPRLDSGARLGVGAFGCVYQPKPVW